MGNSNNFAFGKLNYILMIAGVVCVALGLVIMTTDTEPYGFGTNGIVTGPIVIMVGFVIEFFAIFVKDKSQKDDSDSSES